MSLDAPTAAAEDLLDRVVDRPVRHTEISLRGLIWDVRRDTVDLGAGGEVTREYVAHPGAVAILALRQDRGLDEVLLIQQYRHPIRTLEWELPAGLLDVAGEPPALAAARELAEEADLVAAQWDLLAEYASTPGGMDEMLRIFLARDLRDVPDLDRYERTGEEHGMPSRWVPLRVAVDAVLAGRIRNATASIGLLSAQAMADRGWEGLRPADLPWPHHPRLREQA